MLWPMRAQVKLRCYECRAVFIIRVSDLDVSYGKDLECPNCLRVHNSYVVIDILEIGAKL